jgi:hypothetical protein
MKATLEHLVRCCHGDERPECPILENLSQVGAPTLAGGPAPIRRGAAPSQPRRSKRLVPAPEALPEHAQFIPETRLSPDRQ